MHLPAVHSHDLQSVTILHEHPLLHAATFRVRLDSRKQLVFAHSDTPSCSR